MEGTIATIMMFGGNFAPKNWAVCAGQMMAISSNTALFSLIGTYYGGNGVSTFALPDLQGCVPIGAGQGPGLSSYDIGQTMTAESAYMNINQMPGHTHSAGAVTIPLSTTNASLTDANNNILATPIADTYATAGTTPTVQYGGFSAAMSPQGGGQPFPILQPFECVNFVICLYGVYPARS